MKEYYQKSVRTLQLAGMKKPTQKHDTRAVPMLVAFYNRTPGKINEQMLQDDFLHRKNVDKWSAATMPVCYSSIKFYFINVLQSIQPPKQGAPTCQYREVGR